MSTNNQASNVNEHDRDTFEDAVREEFVRRDFGKISSTADGKPLWQHRQASTTVLSVTRDRDRWSVAADNLLDEGVLLIGGISRTDQLYLFEDAVWCWCDWWGSAELRGRLKDIAKWANDCVDGLDADRPAMISFREMLNLAADDLTRSDLERRFSPERIESTLQELSKVRNQFLASLCSVQEPRFEPLRRAAQAVGPKGPE